MLFYTGYLGFLFKWGLKYSCNGMLVGVHDLHLPPLSFLPLAGSFRTSERFLRYIFCIKFRILKGENSTSVTAQCVICEVPFCSVSRHK